MKHKTCKDCINRIITIQENEYGRFELPCCRLHKRLINAIDNYFGCEYYEDAVETLDLIFGDEKQ